MSAFDPKQLTDLVLRGPRLTLRPWRPADAETVFSALADDAGAGRFTSIPQPYTRADAASFTAEFGNAGRRDATELSCALEESVTGVVVGSASLRPGSCDIGYIVYRSHRGRGLAAEAVRVLTDWAFTHGLRRVGIRCDVENLASARTALQAGFSFEGIARAYPLPRFGGGSTEWVDLAHFGRLPTDSGDPVAPRFVPLPTEGLSDGVVALRPLLPEDADALLEQQNDPVTVSWAFHAEPTSKEDGERLCARAALEWMVGTAARCAVLDVRSGRFAGELTVRLAGPPQVGGIGYVIHPSFRGRGYTTRALRLLLPWAFDVAGFARLELGATVGNVASQRAALHAGFEPDGVRAARLRNPDGSFSDEVRFALVSPHIRRD